MVVAQHPSGEPITKSSFPSPLRSPTTRVGSINRVAVGLDGIVHVRLECAVTIAQKNADDATVHSQIKRLFLCIPPRPNLISRRHEVADCDRRGQEGSSVGDAGCEGTVTDT